MKLYVGAKGVVHKDRKLLLVCEASYKEGTEEGKWDMPGGRIEVGETTIDGLKREIYEETGLTIELSDQKILGVFDAFPTIGGEKCHIIRIYFLVESPSFDITLSADHDEYDWIHPDIIGDKELMTEIPEMIQAFKELKL